MVDKTTENIHTEELRKNKQSWGNSLYTGVKSYNVVGKRMNFFIVSVVIIILCAAALFLRGLNLGIDFKGGSEFTIAGVDQTSQAAAVDAVHEILPSDEPLVSSVGNDSIRVQTGVIDDQDQVNQLRDKLAEAYGVGSDKVSNTAIGPTWGASVGLKALQGLVVFLIACAIFMTIYFRSWRMAVAGIVALLHDLIITVGIYALVGWEITPASVIGFLTILGYSMYDTVVVFDKVRENTKDVLKQDRVTYAEQANLAVNQTLVRSINTTVVALLPVGAVLFFGAFFMGAGTLRDIALALFVGMATGAYSSIFLATPFEVTLRQTDKKIVANTKKVLNLRTALISNTPDGEVTSAKLASAKLMPGKRLENRAQPKRPKTRK